MAAEQVVNPAHNNTTALLVQFTELRGQMDGVSTKLDDLKVAVNQVAAIDKQVAEILIHNQNFTGQIQTVWKRVDELNTWRNNHDNDAGARLDSLKTHITAQLDNLKHEVGNELDGVRRQADVATNGVAEITNQSRGFNKAMTIMVTLFGGAATAGLIYVASTLARTNERLAVIEYQLQQKAKP